MKIINVHSHVYPDKIAVRASEGTGAFYGVKMRHDGSVKNLLETGRRAGIYRHVVCSVATSPEQVRAINGFISQTASSHAEFVGFAAMHPDVDDFRREIEDIIDSGLRGIKLHPDFQKFCADDDKMDALYGAAEGKLPILFHAGDARYDYSGPKRLARVAKKFPGLVVILAHFGGYTEWDDAERILAGLGENVYFDTSSAISFIGRDRARRLIEVYGENRVLFGVDYPMWDPVEEMERFESLCLSDETREKILYKNAAALLKLE
ncbi:MAG: amidohydrolase family protein [Defluviitaleaceae bacterium]|nr:amidohydrolase family protein [Defluviitaleaceae bacterium]